MQFEEKYSSQNCTITFNDSIYERLFVNGESVRGKIIYKKFNVSLMDEKTNLQMNFLKKEIQRDTIFFGTIDLNSNLSNNGLIVNSGKLIRIK